MDSQNSEIQLIKAFKKGDAQAFESLLNLHHKRLYFFLFGLLKSKEDAEEIVQETFLKIWESREHFWEKDGPNAYRVGLIIYLTTNK